MFKEIISCADGGPMPPKGMSIETAYYVGMYDDNGTIDEAWYTSEADARDAFDLLPAEIA